MKLKKTGRRKENSLLLQHRQKIMEKWKKSVTEKAVRLTPVTTAVVTIKPEEDFTDDT